MLKSNAHGPYLVLQSKSISSKASIPRFTTSPATWSVKYRKAVDCSPVNSGNPLWQLLFIIFLPNSLKQVHVFKHWWCLSMKFLPNTWNLPSRITSFKQPSTTPYSASKEEAMDGPHKPSLTQACCSLSCILGWDRRKWLLRLRQGGASTSSAVATCQSGSAGRLPTDEEQVY